MPNPNDNRLSDARYDTTTWGRTQALKAGFNEPGAPAPFGPFTQSPDAEGFKSLVQVQLPADRPSLLSRDVLVYVSAVQNYGNNPQIVNAAGAPIVTPIADQLHANAGLYGLVRSGRGGQFSEQEFIVPAHGIALHVGADSVEVSVGFFPSRTGWGTGAEFLGARATGWDIEAGVATAGSYVDRVRQELPVSSASDLVFRIPEFSRRLRVATMTPDLYLLDWRDWLGRSIPVGPLTSPIYYADAAAPIPIDARFVVLTRLATANGVLGDQVPHHPVTLEWERQS